MKIADAVIAAQKEYEQAVRTFPKALHSKHEGFAVLKEEVDELWEEIKRKDSRPDAVKKEALQVAAMALRFLVDIA